MCSLRKTRPAYTKLLQWWGLQVWTRHGCGWRSLSTTSICSFGSGDTLRDETPEERPLTVRTAQEIVETEDGINPISFFGIPVERESTDGRKITQVGTYSEDRTRSTSSANSVAFADDDKKQALKNLVERSATPRERSTIAPSADNVSDRNDSVRNKPQESSPSAGLDVAGGSQNWQAIATERKLTWSELGLEESPQEIQSAWRVKDVKSHWSFVHKRVDTHVREAICRSSEGDLLETARSAGLERNLAVIEECREAMRSRKLYGNTAFIAALITAYSSAGDFGSACSLWDTMPTKLKDENTYNAWLLAICKRGDLDHAKEILRCMREAQVSTSLIGRHKVADLLLDYNRVEDCQDILLNLLPYVKRGTREERDLFCSSLQNLVRFYINEERHDTASYFLLYMVAQGLPMETYVLRLLLECCEDDIERIEHILKIAERKGVSLGSSVWNKLSLAYLRRRKFAGLTHTLERMRAKVVSADGINRTMMLVLAESNSPHQTLQAFQKLSKKQLRDFHVILRAKFPAEQVLPEVLRAGFRPDETTFGILSASIYRQLGAHKESLDRIMDTMLRLELDPRSFRFQKELLKEASRTFDRQEFENLVNYFRDTFPGSETAIYNRAIRHLVNAREFAAAERFLRSESADTGTIEVLAMGYLRDGNVERAAQLVFGLESPSRSLRHALKRARQLTGKDNVERDKKSEHKNSEAEDLGGGFWHDSTKTDDDETDFDEDNGDIISEIIGEDWASGGGENLKIYPE
eukprot:Plantae.Rhodophyta-Purpureofilum_apyrenoidigerum.ctg5912.p1 GENE.Plantae.Rhodophyta-Purpureofilum_apyrenoidigerum.ctg5912~~Plantae.Rhodophyta-Purpureofilum_apyrenoidigerum.ctg5912.p1  ORF type:complete len:754 (+),score=122.12 Plantae.Rhodophyta-Purpureofilum_apyrenoidigerum.ctg5912:116-2377(+)